MKIGLKRDALTEAEHELLSVGCALRQLNAYTALRPEQFRQNGSALMRICNVPDCEAYRRWIAVGTEANATSSTKVYPADVVCALSSEGLHIID